MIRRHAPRPRGQYQDFHFFAAGDPIANIEAQFSRPSEIVSAPAPPNPQPQPAEPKPQAAPAETVTAEIIRPATDLVMRPANDPDQLDDESGEDGEANDSPGTESLERAIAFLDSIPAAVGLPGSQLRAIDELQALEPKQARHATRTKRASSKAARRKSAARLATPRRAKARRALTHGARESHETQCTICGHPYRAEIENEFMHWHNTRHIAYDYKVSRSAIYRHAYALGLFSRRDRLLRFSLGHLIEGVQNVEPTADSIVRAVHLFSRINDDGQCVEPPAHVIVSSGTVHREAAMPHSRRAIAIQLDSPALTSGTGAPDPADWAYSTPPREAERSVGNDAAEGRGPQRAPHAGVLKGGTANQPSHNANH